MHVRSSAQQTPSSYVTSGLPALDIRVWAQAGTTVLTEDKATGGSIIGITPQRAVEAEELDCRGGGLC